MNRYAQVLTASALAYTAQASAVAKWARGTTMSSPPQFIATAEQLVALTKEPKARHLVVCGNLANVPSFRLAPAQTLAGNGDNASISFVKGVDIALSQPRPLQLIPRPDRPDRTTYGAVR